MAASVYTRHGQVVCEPLELKVPWGHLGFDLGQEKWGQKQKLLGPFHTQSWVPV